MHFTKFSVDNFYREKLIESSKNFPRIKSISFDRIAYPPMTCMMWYARYNGGVSVIKS